MQELPPYNGFGSLEDSKQSCLSLIPLPPKKDVIKMLENDGKMLRFAADMVSSHAHYVLIDCLGKCFNSAAILCMQESTRPEDKNRKFIICYRLADDMMTIFEPPQRCMHAPC